MHLCQSVNFLLFVFSKGKQIMEIFFCSCEKLRDNYKHFCKVSSNPLKLSFKQPNYWNQQKWQKDLIMYHLVEVKRLQSRALRFTMSSFWRCRNRKMSAWEFCTWKRRDSVDDCDSQVLRSMLGLQVTEEQLQCIAERAIQEADADKDDAISFDEFRKVRTTPLLTILIWIFQITDVFTLSV